MKLEWIQAPVKTEWGDEMVVASLAIDKDHTVCFYCERDQTAKVDAMFAQRTWVGLTVEEINEVLGGAIHDEPNGLLEFVRAIEAKLKEKNT